MPESTRNKGRERSAEAGLLSFGRDTQIHVVSEPVVRVKIPAAKICASVLCQFNFHGFDVGQAIPFGAASCRINAVVANASQYACTLGKAPHTVVLHACSKAEHIQKPDATEEAVLEVIIGQIEAHRIPAREFEKGKDPQ